MGARDRPGIPGAAVGHNGRVPTPAPEPAGRTEAPNQREHILRTALSLMSQQGVDGTSMRSLAAATGLNVATLYHYFPSKRDLLVAVLEERGFLDTPGVATPALTGPGPGADVGRSPDRTSWRPWWRWRTSSG